MSAHMMCGSPAATQPAIFPTGALKVGLSRSASLYLLASITASYLASSSAPTPLYPIYQSEWRFSPVAVSFVFGIYAIAVLGALLVAGRLSDYIGRRPVLIVATTIQAATSPASTAARTPYRPRYSSTGSAGLP